jgi:sugar O-acyltransferase (sialic acid O-acetyltransferase NeuD family)
MNKPLVIFGVGDMAEVMYGYFTADSDYDVVAFTVDAAYVRSGEKFGVPVIPYEELARHYGPDDCEMFVAGVYGEFNRTRRALFDRVSSDGYRLARYISSHAAVFSERIGRNVFVAEFATIQPFASVGDNVFVWPYTIVGHHASVADDCYLGALAFIGGNTRVGVGCVVGPGAIVGSRRSLGERTFVGAKCAIFKDSPAGAIFLEPGSQPTPYTVDTVPEAVKARLFHP